MATQRCCCDFTWNWVYNMWYHYGICSFSFNWGSRRRTDISVHRPRPVSYPAVQALDS